jgi:hypothetical protein
VKPIPLGSDRRAIRWRLIVPLIAGAFVLGVLVGLIHGR